MPKKKLNIQRKKKSQSKTRKKKAKITQQSQPVPGQPLPPIQSPAGLPTTPGQP